MKMFRGRSRAEIDRRLKLRGWPDAAASLMADYLTDYTQRKPPRWSDLVAAPSPLSGSNEDGERLRPQSERTRSAQEGKSGDAGDAGAPLGGGRNTGEGEKNGGGSTG